ncbi:17285_t:CDS:2, partial [Racocetra persica]
MNIWHRFIFLISILSLPLVNTLPLKSPKSVTIPFMKPLKSHKPVAIPLKKSNKLSPNHNSKLSTINDPPIVNASLMDDFHHDDQYFCEITLGGQKFNVMIDTGFGNLLIPSIDCTSACDFKNKYNQSKDIFFRTNNKTFGYVYGNGLVEGIRGQTFAMNIGGYSPGSRHKTDPLPDQQFGLVTKFPNNFKFTEFDVRSMFSLKIGREADGTGSELIIGDVDQSKFTGEIFYTRMINDNDDWIIPLDDLSINGKFLGFQNRTGKFASGFSSIVVPFDDAKLIYQHIPNARDRDGKFIIPCESKIKI